MASFNMVALLASTAPPAGGREGEGLLEMVDRVWGGMGSLAPGHTS